MDTKTSLGPNIFCIVIALAALVFSASQADQTTAFLLAYLVAAATILFCAYRAAAGDSTQIMAGPVTAVILLVVFDNFQVRDAQLEGLLCLLLLAIALGSSVFSLLNPDRARIPVLVMGSIVGLVGVFLTTAAINHHVPGYSLFIPFDEIQKFNPLHIDYFPQRTDAELQDAVRHNAALESRGSQWTFLLFLLQTVAISAWDAVILSLGVWLAGLAATPVMRLFVREGAR